MMQEEKRPNWVQARADCTLQGTFEQIVDAVKQDIACFNKLPSEQRKSLEVALVWRAGDAVVGYATSSGIALHDDIVSIKTASRAVRISRNDEVLFEVEREWNEQTLVCDLKINGTIHSLWQISQKAIGDLLFPHQS